MVVAKLEIMAIRCFIAVELDKAVARKVARLQLRCKEKLGQNCSKLKWTNPEHNHITLKFLGDVPDSLVNEICKALDQTLQQFEPFEIEPDRLATLPQRGTPRVLVVETTVANKQLEKLHATLQNELVKIGLPPDKRRFHGHLTLARIKNTTVAGQVREMVDEYPPVSLGRQAVDRITLLQSQLDRTGPMYSRLHGGVMRCVGQK